MVRSKEILQIWKMAEFRLFKFLYLFTLEIGLIKSEIRLIKSEIGIIKSEFGIIIMEMGIINLETWTYKP